MLTSSIIDLTDVKSNKSSSGNSTDSSCSMEKDSLRAALNSEQAKTKNWEQSYETMKKSNETCARALSVSIEANEKSKEKEKQSKSQAAMMTSSSFMGGLAVGMLLFWLIFD